jgi:hypothetical protein
MASGGASTMRIINVVMKMAAEKSKETTATL